MKQEITLAFRDESHLKAHLADFAVSLEEALGWVRQVLEGSETRSGWEHFDFEAPRIAGKTGLARVWPWTRGDFWARRKGRAIPSHLILGSKKDTRWLCVHGLWQNEASFLLHTLYPGRVAPREIDDPGISPDELPEARAFWRRHAIIVSIGDWEA